MIQGNPELSYYEFDTAKLLAEKLEKDLIEHLERIRILKIGNEWKISETLMKSRDIIDEMGISIMQVVGVID